MAPKRPAAASEAAAAGAKAAKKDGVAQYAACSLECCDFSRDTETYSVRWDVLLDVNDCRYELLKKHNLMFAVVPSTYMWEDGSGMDKHLYEAKAQWSPLQIAIYQSLATIAHDLLCRKGTTSLQDLAGQGPLEVVPGKLTLVTEFGRAFCTKEHSPEEMHCCHDRYTSDYHAPMPTCFCDLQKFVEFSSKEKLKEMKSDLETAGFPPVIRS
ncbi:TE1 [Symbiodinium sp. CCMP2592]|nr:TE1 [Symbiodinium sp. CCMP2592]